ncbi:MULTISPECIES: SUKH-3 domain-containing protein [Actinoplanes]|uniref:SUKH-3 domain-containing protein n=1 Tax=Actinoplanes TaxID=1865 RepID=UPI0005F2E761|nr:MULTISPECIES: SUKH-3 domain-containing protein [Actinoplanes]GLY03498.1 hypothetical protein Acsp01_38770 [Actinoplanes sp. NBRC 101535]
MTHPGQKYPYRFPAEVLEILSAAGWKPGRHVDVEPWRSGLADDFSMHDAAARFLAEFGGLFVNIDGPGVQKAREAFELDPMRGVGDDRLGEWSAELGRSLFPVGEFSYGYPFLLAVDETGELYHVLDSLATYGPLPRALEKLILGYRARPLLEDF